MNTFKLSIIVAVAALSACANADGGYDASGVFETTEVVVSAKENGEIIRFDLAEGQTVADDVAFGLIDTTQLYLQKMLLAANIRATNSRRVDIPRQTAAVRQQIETLRSERKRFATLVEQNVANRKQLDDIEAQILAFEKQLAAQTETLSGTNSALDSEHQSLIIRIAQIDDRIRNSIIRSPIAGTVLSKYAEAGELAAQGRALFKVANLSVMYLRAYMTAAQLSSITVGQQVEVYADMGEADSRKYAGTVAWISDRAEFTPKTIQTRDERDNLVYAVKIAVRNDGHVRQGMYGHLSLQR
jgi:HlyD family secretion protein